MIPNAPIRLTNLSSEQMRDFATEAQQTALASGDAAKVREANDRALAEGILASLGSDTSRPAPRPGEPEAQAEPGRPRRQPADPSAVPRRRLPPETEYEAARKQTAQLRDWLNHHGFDVIPNSGGGRSNCLLISLMQHATGNYASEHEAEVSELRQALVEQSGGAESGALFGDTGSDSSLRWLVNRINRDYAQPGRTLTVWIASSFVDDQPSFLKVGNGELAAMIFESNSHFEAAVPRGTIKR